MHKDSILENRVFGRKYAEAYDVLYHDKNYAAECDTIEEVFRTRAEQPINTVLDLGCGTGNHAFPLSKRGYQITGVDRSHEMIDRAQRKVNAQHPLPKHTPQFIRGDIQTLRLKKQFDAVIAMFAVLGYQITDRELSNTLTTIRHHINTSGLFIFDVWYGPAVLAIGPENRQNEFPTDSGAFIRKASAHLDTRRRICQVTYRLQETVGGRVANEVTEKHAMRYFFPDELDSMFFQHGMKLQSLTAYPDLHEPADDTTWNAMGVARAM